MPKEFNCPSCAESITFQGGDSIFQTCKSCNAPVIVPSEFLYKKEERLASESFASLVNDKPVDVEQVTNELTPGGDLPKAGDSLETHDPEARIEKFEVYQEKIGTHGAEMKKAVDEIISPKKEVDFKTATPYANPFNQNKKTSDSRKPQQKIPLNPVLVRIQNELQTGNKIEAIKIFRSRFNTGLKEAKDAVEALQRGENIDISNHLEQEG